MATKRGIPGWWQRVMMCSLAPACAGLHSKTQRLAHLKRSNVRGFAMDLQTEVCRWVTSGFSTHRRISPRFPHGHSTPTGGGRRQRPSLSRTGRGFHSPHPRRQGAGRPARVTASAAMATSMFSRSSGPMIAMARANASHRRPRTDRFSGCARSTGASSRPLTGNLASCRATPLQSHKLPTRQDGPERHRQG